MKNIKGKNKYFFPIILFLFFDISSSLDVCPTEGTIIKNCKIDYCSGMNFSSFKEKTQCLNNIIVVGENGYRYINFASYSNQSMVLETTKIPQSQDRKFFGITQHGRPFFKDETLFYEKTIGEKVGSYEATGIIIKLLGGGEEYFLSMSKIGGKTEIFDFYGDKFNSKELKDFTSIDQVSSLRHAFISLYNTQNYLIGYLGCNNIYFDYLTGICNDIKLHFRRYTFQNFYINSGNTYMQPLKEKDAFGKQVSCFQTTTNKFIICFYLKKEVHPPPDYLVKFNFIKYKENLTEEINSSITSTIIDENLFNKCVHLTGDIGVFASYKKSGGYYYPLLFVMEFINNNFSKYIDNDITIEINLNYDVLLNDIVKLDDKKVAFSATVTNKETLYIIIINIYSKTKYKIRTYPIKISDIYHYKLMRELRIHNYNNFLAFASSFCTDKSPCDNDYGIHYSGLIIFSYPNSDDDTLQLEDYISANNTIDVKNLEIDLKDKLIIDNNIFGYVLSKIKIIKIDGECPEYKSYSSLDDTKEIKENYNLTIDENIVFKFTGNDNKLEKVDKKIQYQFIATEPEYEIYDNYSQNSNLDDKSEFKKGEYIGRLSYYYIKSNDKISFNCPQHPNCYACKDVINGKCYTCYYDFIPDDTKGKICYDVPTTSITTIPTTIITTIPSTIITTIPTTIITTIPTTIITTIPTTILTRSPTTIITIIPTTILTTELFIPTTITNYQEEETQTTQKLTEKLTEELINIDNTCSKDDILNNKCKEGSITDDQLSGIYQNIKDKYLNSDNNGKNTIIETENVAFQVSTLEDQKNSDNPNISSIDLGGCEQELRDEYGIPAELSLIVFKTDIKTQNSTQTYVQYEIYDPRNFTKLNLTICKNDKISVSTPVKLSQATSSLYDILKESGYDLFNENDDFYTDICSTFTSESGTDMTLADRKQQIFQKAGNVSLCQKGCDLEYYNSTTKKAKCQCSPQIEETLPVLSTSKEKFSPKNIADSFFSTLKNSNFYVLKCYKLAIDLKTLWINYGRILMTIILILSLFFLIIFGACDRKNIIYFLQSIVKQKMNYNKNSEKKTKNKNLKEKKIKNNIKKKINKKSNSKKKKSNNKKNAPPKRNISPSNNKSKFKLSKNKKLINSKTKLKDNLAKESNKNKSKLNKKDNKKNRTNINIIRIKNINIKNLGGKAKGQNINFNEISKKINKKIMNKRNNKNILNNKSKEKINYYQSSKHILKTKSKFNNNLRKEFEYQNLNDQELNSLEYDLAIILDKRTYFQYYWSLLKKKHLILFTFYPANDYNLISIKICLLLLSFSLYFTINGFFFSDATMHKIHEDNGSFNILFQLPQILYSTIISSIINIILKQLSLSEKNILTIKQEKNLVKIREYSKSIKTCLTIKFIIYIFLNIILLLFFWYFISCFCAVYRNTQMILIKDTLFSFGLSMLYPFGLNLLPGFFRIPALRANKKDKKCLYNISTYIALI